MIFHILIVQFSNKYIMKVIYMPQLLNNIGNKRLKTRRASSQLRKPSQFSIIFLGDPHVGMNHRQHPTCIYHLANYKAILKSINSSDNSLIAIFNGGDGADNANFISNFASVTETLMNAKPHKIPFFSAVGNHEYIHDSTLDEYKKYISKKESDVIKLYGQNFGPKVAIIMLDTGGPSSNGCKNDKGTILAKSIAQIKNSAAYKSIIKDKSVKIIIDMHIPPRMSVFTQTTKTHVLCPDAEKHFRQFVKNIGLSRFLAIVTHHKHGFIQPHINSQYFFLNKIPVFLTAQGGNCDPAISSDLSAKYSYYKMQLSTTTPNSRDNYKLKSIFRFDVDVKNSKISKTIQVF